MPREEHGTWKIAEWGTCAASAESMDPTSSGVKKECRWSQHAVSFSIR